MRLECLARSEDGLLSFVTLRTQRSHRRAEHVQRHGHTRYLLDDSLDRDCLWHSLACDALIHRQQRCQNSTGSTLRRLTRSLINSNDEQSDVALPPHCAVRLSLPAVNLFLICLPSEDEPRLQLEHPRRVDICECRDCVRGRAHGPNKLAERGSRCRAITVNGDPAAEEIPVIEEIETPQ